MAVVETLVPNKVGVDIIFVLRETRPHVVVVCQVVFSLTASTTPGSFTAPVFQIFDASDLNTPLSTSAACTWVDTSPVLCTVTGVSTGSRTFRARVAVTGFVGPLSNSLVVNGESRVVVAPQGRHFFDNSILVTWTAVLFSLPTVTVTTTTTSTAVLSVSAPINAPMGDSSPLFVVEDVTAPGVSLSTSAPCTWSTASTPVACTVTSLAAATTFSLRVSVLLSSDPPEFVR